MSLQTRGRNNNGYLDLAILDTVALVEFRSKTFRQHRHFMKRRHA